MEKLSQKQLEKKENKIEKEEKQLEKKQEEIKEELTRIQQLKKKTKDSAKKFDSEFRKSTNTAIVAAFSFLIGLVWKDVIVNFVNKIIHQDAANGSLIAAILVTLICVIGIMITTTLLIRKKE